MTSSLVIFEAAIRVTETGKQQLLVPAASKTVDQPRVRLKSRPTEEAPLPPTVLTQQSTSSTAATRSTTASSMRVILLPELAMIVVMIMMKKIVPKPIK